MKKVLLGLAALAISVSLLTACGQKQEAPASSAPAGMMEVESTLIQSVGYDAAAQEMTFILRTGDEIYTYKNVPQTVYDELMAAESKGSYYRMNIRDKYEFTTK